MPDKASLERVKLLRKEYELQTRGHREQIARIVCTAFRQAKQIQKSSQKRQEFFHLVGKRPASKKKVSLVTEMMVYVIGAKSNSKRKRAWKYGRAVQFLSDAGTALSDLEKKIKQRGGLEAVAKQAAESQSRRPKTSASLLDRKPYLKRAQSDDAASNKDKMDPTNDQKTTLAIEIQMSDLDEALPLV